MAIKIIYCPFLMLENSPKNTIIPAYTVFLAPAHSTSTLEPVRVKVKVGKCDLKIKRVDSLADRRAPQASPNAATTQLQHLPIDGLHPVQLSSAASASVSF